MKQRFRAFAEATANAAGSHWAFVLALAVILIWGITGPVFRYSDTWQLVINTGTTIVTFLMIFLVQNTQNRETRITRLKLDELLRGVEGARTELVNLDHMSDRELDELEGEFLRLSKKSTLVHDDLAHVRREIGVRREARAETGDGPDGDELDAPRRA